MAEPQIRHPADGVMVGKGPGSAKKSTNPKKKSTNPNEREFSDNPGRRDVARGLPSPQELFATVTIGGAGMRLNMYCVPLLHTHTQVHTHTHKYTAIVRFRLNCCRWETTPVGSHLPSLVGVICFDGGN